MSIFDIFYIKKKEPSADLLELSEFKHLMHELLDMDKFIARSDYVAIFEKFKDLYQKFDTLKKSDTLGYFCKNNRIAIHEAETFLSVYEESLDKEGSDIIRKHNETYIKKHLISENSYLDDILNEVDPAIKLDEQQRRVILSDEDYTLVIAGAGAGKTTTVAAKVKYLVEKKGIRPDQILVISFTNKAVGELQDKINKALKIDCPVTTFHKAGYAILRKQDSDRKIVAAPGFMFNVINNYLKSNILENPELVDKLILFFGSYFDAPFEGDGLNDFFNYIKKADFSTLRGNMDEYAEQIIDKRTGKCISIAHEFLRSRQEVRIANFLYMNALVSGKKSQKFFENIEV